MNRPQRGRGNYSFGDVNQYLADLAQHGDPVLLEMEAEARERRFPIIGPAAGQLCYMLARAVNATQVFEMGSGYGYSTAWFAKAVKDNGGGTVRHVVWDEELSEKAKQYLGKMNLNDCVQYAVGEAVETLRNADGPFDIVFNDIDKDGYPASYEVLKPKIRAGGLVIVDNMLWGGRAWNDAIQDDSTQGVRGITKLLYEDPDFACSLIPIRDGLIVGWKSA